LTDLRMAVSEPNTRFLHSRVLESHPSSFPEVLVKH
jgi:hypothetical protein